MEDLLECDKFQKKPTIDVKEFVDYFNLEFGLYQFDESEPQDEDAFTQKDFHFIGYFVSKYGQERMYFSVRGRQNLFAIAVPLTNGQAMLSMTEESPIGRTEITLE